MDTQIINSFFCIHLETKINVCTQLDSFNSFQKAATTIEEKKKVGILYKR